MIVIKKKCETCGKFEVPEAQHHLVKADQADKVCQCAHQAASLVGLVVILPFMLLGLGVLAIAAPPPIFWLAGFIAGAFTFGLIVFLAIRLAIAPLAKH
jgi:hypothetical protein